MTKSCHHLDLLSWWIDDLPVEVMGHVSRQYYLTDAPLAKADIDDTVAGAIRYEKGQLAMYSLVGYADREGCSLQIQGSSGRLDVEWDAKSSSDHVIHVKETGKPAFKIDIPASSEPHGGADSRMLSHYFGFWSPDPSSLASAAAAVTIGEAITQSSKQNGRAIDISQTDAVAYLRQTSQKLRGKESRRAPLPRVRE